jgi:glycosyltransferase involved in cell wall biosynthesis
VKVAYVLGTSAGGTVRHVWMLATGLAGRHVAVTVYGPAQTWAAVRACAEAPTGSRGAACAQGAPRIAGGPAGACAQAVPFEPVEITERPRPVRDVAAVRRLRSRLRRSRPDVVHAHGLRAAAVAALAVGRSRHRPRLVVTVHNAAPAGGLAAAVYRMLEWLVARRADQVLCVSTDLEARMRALGAKRVGRALVPAPSLPAPPLPAPPLPAPPRRGASAEAPAGLKADGAPIVLTVARLAAQKGLHTLIEAAGRWRDRDPVPLVVVAGTGPLLGDLTAAARAAGVRARFLGHRDDVPALLAAADVVVLPSLWEGQPLIVHEALAAGRPLIASRTGGIADLTGEGAALLVPPGDAAALSAAVLSVLDDPDLAARLSQAAVKRAAALPTEEDALDAALSAYRKSR